MNIIKVKRVIIETTKIFYIKYKEIGKEYKVIINHLLNNQYEVTGEENNIRNFLINNNQYIIRVEVKES